MFRNDKPLFLPPGSVRAVIAIVTVGAFIAGQIGSEVPLAVIAFYFGTRVQQENGS